MLPQAKDIGYCKKIYILPRIRQILCPNKATRPKFRRINIYVAGIRNHNRNKIMLEGRLLQGYANQLSLYTHIYAYILARDLKALSPKPDATQTDLSEYNEKKIVLLCK